MTENSNGAFVSPNHDKKEKKRERGKKRDKRKQGISGSRIDMIGQPGNGTRLSELR